NARLWRGPEATHLTRKAFAVLHYLVEHAQQLVTKDELLEVVWSQTHVSEAALAVCIREIRQALGDHPRTPRFIETVHGRGYRFLATVTVADRLPETRETALRLRLTPPSSSFAPPLARLRPGLLVGREADFVHLQQWLDSGPLLVIVARETLDAAHTRYVGEDTYCPHARAAHAYQCQPRQYGQSLSPHAAWRIPPS